MIRLTLRVPDDVYLQIQERARSSRRSINSQIVFDLENADDHEGVRGDVDQYGYDDQGNRFNLNQRNDPNQEDEVKGNIARFGANHARSSNRKT